MEKTNGVPESVAQKQLTQLSYQTALARYQSQQGLARISWITWIIVLGTTLFWCFTAIKTAQMAGAHDLYSIVQDILSNAINVQDRDNNALSSVLITYGAKDNHLIQQGEYWRFITPIFLHANALHVGLNMLNLFVLGVFLERLLGHTRFLLIYLVTGIISIIASFVFAPAEISVGASGAIFVLTHRRAFRRNGIPTLLWLIFIIGINLSIGLFVQNVDNYAHIGGLVSGCLLGWWFTPLYRVATGQRLTDTHSLARRWPLALLTILGTLILAIIALYLTGG